MSKLPRFLTVSDPKEKREYIICTNKPACIAEIFEYTSLDDAKQLKENPYEDWFIKLDNNKIAIVDHTKYHINGTFYVIVIRKFFEIPKDRDIPNNDRNGIVGRMVDWLYSTKKDLNT